MINFTPDINIRDLSKYLTHSKKENGLWSTNKNQSLYPLSRSSWSIKLICDWYLASQKKDTLILWIPAYFCYQALAPALADKKVHIKYYPVKPDHSPDWNLLQTEMASTGGNLFLLVHYFGKENDTFKASKFCKEHSMLLIEDSTHVMIPTSTMGKLSQFSLYSPYKFFPIPNGAFLIAQGLTDEDKNILDSLFKSLTSSGSSQLKWFIKKLIKWLLPVFIMNSLRAKTFQFEDNESSSPVLPAPQISSTALNYLSHLTPEAAEKISLERKKNAKALLEAISYFTKPEGFYFSEQSPYALFLNLTNAKKPFEKLLANNLPCAPWPDLPPHKAEDNGFNQAEAIRKNSLIVPVYQGMKLCHSFKAIKKLITNDYHQISFSVNQADKTQWQKLLSECSRSNLLQDWDYGEAKKNEGWLPERIIIKFNQKEIGMVQVLKKKLPVFKIYLYRINRGPLFINTVKDQLSVQMASLKKIRWHYSLFKLKPLFVAPEKNDSPLMNYLLKSFKMFNYSSGRYLSAWIDLSQPLDVLRKNLMQKWRNMLNSAEKNNLELVADNDQSHLNWLIERYKELMSQKGFQGVPVSIIESLYAGTQKDNFMVLSAKESEEICASILLSIHGDSATYLVGWNGDKGRNLKANNFLLWNAVVELKKKDLKWFDLGGMDEKNLPHITLFKKGLSGEEYNLCGEWLS